MFVKPIDFKLFTKLRLHVPKTYSDKLLIYFQGHDNDLCEKIADKTNNLVLEVKYPSFPCSIELGIKLVNYFMDDYHITLIGDGIGANIATSLAMKIRDMKMPNVDSQILICPVTYYDHINTPFDSAKKSKLTEEITKDYVNGNDRFNIYATPLMATVYSQLPKTLSITAKQDYLKDEGEIYSYLLHKAKNEITFKRIDATHDIFSEKIESQIIGIISNFLG